MSSDLEVLTRLDHGALSFVQLDRAVPTNHMYRRKINASAAPNGAQSSSVQNTHQMPLFHTYKCGKMSAFFVYPNLVAGFDLISSRVVFDMAYKMCLYVCFC